jgi:hypothetical protein
MLTYTSLRKNDFGVVVFLKKNQKPPATAPKAPTQSNRTKKVLAK